MCVSWIYRGAQIHAKEPDQEEPTLSGVRAPEHGGWGGVTKVTKYRPVPAGAPAALRGLQWTNNQRACCHEKVAMWCTTATCSRALASASLEKGDADAKKRATQTSHTVSSCKHTQKPCRPELVTHRSKERSPKANSWTARSVKHIQE